MGIKCTVFCKVMNGLLAIDDIDAIIHGQSTQSYLQC